MREHESMKDIKNKDPQLQNQEGYKSQGNFDVTGT
jgi:hypothetical protein